MCCCGLYKLKIKLTKTEHIVISSKKSSNKVIESVLSLDDGEIKLSDTVHNMGVTMDTYLDMHSHVSNI